jgi:hypothetical protein
MDLGAPPARESSGLSQPSGKGKSPLDPRLALPCRDDGLDVAELTPRLDRLVRKERVQCAFVLVVLRYHRREGDATVWATPDESQHHPIRLPLDASVKRRAPARTARAEYWVSVSGMATRASDELGRAKGPALRGHRAVSAAAAAGIGPPVADRRILLVVTTPVDEESLRSELVRRGRGVEPLVKIVAPARLSRLEWLTNDEDAARADAEGLATGVADRLGPAASEAEAGDPDPLQAIEDALRSFEADEIVLVSRSEEDADWLERGVHEEGLEGFGLPVSRLVVADEDSAGS